MHITKRSVRLVLAALFSMGILFLLTGTVSAQTARPALPAHASVLSAIPAIGSTIKQPPTSVTVFTAENINPDPKVSNLFVYGPSGEATGKLISQGNAKVSFTNPKEMSVNIKSNAGHLYGVYIVHWITKSALDGDPDEGAFTFTVSSSGAATTATPAATAASTSGQTTTTTNNSGSGGAPIWLAAVIALVALVVGFGGGLVLGFSRRRTTAPSGSVGGMRQSLQQEQEDTTNRP